MSQKTNELKGAIYDRLVVVEKYRSTINQIQNQISEIQKQLAEAEKEEQKEQKEGVKVESNSKPSLEEAVKRNKSK